MTSIEEKLHENLLYSQVIEPSERVTSQLHELTSPKSVFCLYSRTVDLTVYVVPASPLTIHQCATVCVGPCETERRQYRIIMELILLDALQIQYEITTGFSSKSCNNNTAKFIVYSTTMS